MNDKFIVFHVQGGIGKHVVSTAIAKTIKNNYPNRRLIVVCYYPDMFLGLDFVDRVYHGNYIPYFYQDYIEGKDTIIFKGEPYDTSAHIHKKKHLIESWCELFGLQYNGEQPQLNFSIAHESTTSSLINPQRPILLLQTSGGLFGGENLSGYKWSRDLPPKLAQRIVYAFMNEYEVVQIKQRNGYTLQGVTQFNEQLAPMQLFHLLTRTSKRILIDSSLQHASAVMGLKSDVFWIGTSPKVFGYELHNNIVANSKNYKLPDSFLFDYSFDGVVHECPYQSEEEMFNFDEVLNILKDGEKEN